MTLLLMEHKVYKKKTDLICKRQVSSRLHLTVKEMVF